VRRRLFNEPVAVREVVRKNAGQLRGKLHFIIMSKRYTRN
jgi:hypothetical protein